MRVARVVVLVLLVALIVGLGPVAWGQKQPRATCLDCHRAEGMKYAVIQTTPFVEVPKGETQDLEVIIGNPWLHDINSALVTVNLANATGVTFDVPDPYHAEQALQLTFQQNVSDVPFPVEAGATGVIVRATQPPDPSPIGLIDADLQVVFPEGAPARTAPDGFGGGSPTPARLVEQIALAGEDTANRPAGEWIARVRLASGPPTGTAVGLSVDVFYNSTTSQSQLLADVIKPGRTDSIPFRVRGTGDGPQELDFDIVVTAHYIHPAGIGAQDDGNATLNRGLNFTVGQSLRLGSLAPPVPPVPPINWKLNGRIWGEATGFIGLFIVPLTLVLGGAFGTKNVLWANRVVHSARLRVLWHNALSYILLVVTAIHLGLFLYEEVYDWSVGMVWGGLGTLGLLGLAITGGFQRWFARRVGYANWRLLHISMAIVFVAATLVHVLVDGAHFDVFRKWFGLASK